MPRPALLPKAGHLYACRIAQSIGLRSKILLRSLEPVSKFCDQNQPTYLMLGARFIWMSLWIVAVIGTLKLCFPPLIKIAVILSLAWTAEFRQNVANLTMSSVVVLYYFEGNCITLHRGSACLGHYIFESRRLLVYGYDPNDTLHHHLHGKDGPVMDWATHMKIAARAARGIAYLQEYCHPGFIHKVIKSSNIFLDNNLEARVSDFGLAQIALDADTHDSTRVMGLDSFIVVAFHQTYSLFNLEDNVLLMETTMLRTYRYIIRSSLTEYTGPINFPWQPWYLRYTANQSLGCQKEFTDHLVSP